MRSKLTQSVLHLFKPLNRIIELVLEGSILLAQSCDRRLVRNFLVRILLQMALLFLIRCVKLDPHQLQLIAQRAILSNCRGRHRASVVTDALNCINSSFLAATQTLLQRLFLILQSLYFSLQSLDRLVDRLELIIVLLAKGCHWLLKACRLLE